MKAQSAKAKGRLFQQLVRDAILEKFPQLEPDDCRSTSMGASGEDILLSPAARKLFPFSVECKSIARFAGYKYLEQSDSNQSKGTASIAVVKANRKEPIVLIKLKDFMELVG